MDKNDFASLKRAMAQVDDYQGGQRTGFVIHEPVDVKAMPATGKSQASIKRASRAIRSTSE